ncbi:MAG: hypothetical protein AB8B50_20230 [Pirellulaceae bacterium]
MSVPTEPANPSPNTRSPNPFVGQISPDEASPSLRSRVTAFVGKRPDLVVLLCFLILDALLFVGNATSGLFEPSRLFRDWSWLRCRPFLIARYDTDALLFALASSQVALLSCWFVFSRRSFVTRAAIHCQSVATLVLLMMLGANGNPVALLAALLCIGFGSALGSIGLRSQGWEWRALDARAVPKAGIGIREMMLSTMLVALLCITVGGIFSFSDSTAWQDYLRELISWKSLCNHLAIILLGMATGAMALVAQAPTEHPTARRKLLALVFSALIFAAFFGLHLLQITFSFYQMSFFFVYVDKLQQTSGVAIWGGVQLVFQVLGFYLVSRAGWRLTQVDLKPKSVLASGIRSGVQAATVAAIVVAGYFGWVLFAGASRIESANQIIYGIGIVARDKPENGGELFVSLLEGISQEQADSLQESLPELRRLVVFSPEAVDTPEELEILASMMNIGEFDLKGAVLSLDDEQVEAFRRSRPDATIDF